ncbi:unnamed protein product, partial [Meganyctiphanes norvegica]
ISAANVKDIPVNFALEGAVKLINTYSTAKGNDLPECAEHQLPVSHRCSSHKAWICQRCVSEEHFEVSCRVTTTSEELNVRKSTQLDKSQPLINTFEEICKNADDCMEQCKKLIEEDEKEIIRLQRQIQRRKDSKMQKEEKIARFDQKLEMLKGKLRPYEQAVKTLKSSETIRGVSRCSDDVQREADNLNLFFQELTSEVDS